MLGHSDGSVTAIYNRNGYVKEMRAVLENWAAELTGRDGSSSVPLPPSVVPLRMVPAIRVVTGEAA